jgi:hypothetical protein
MTEQQDKRSSLDELLNQIRARRQETLAELTNVTENEFALATGMERWSSVRRVLLRFGDHMREHANQIEGARQSTQRHPTMPQRMLAEGEVAWGKLLAATVGLSDEDIDVRPPDGGWTIRETLEHILDAEHNYGNAIQKARGRKQPSRQD